MMTIVNSINGILWSNYLIYTNTLQKIQLYSDSYSINIGSIEHMSKVRLTTPIASFLEKFPSVDIHIKQGGRYNIEYIAWFSTSHIEGTCCWIVPLHIHLIKVKAIYQNLLTIAILTTKLYDITILSVSNRNARRIKSKMDLFFININHKWSSFISAFLVILYYLSCYE